MSEIKLLPCPFCGGEAILHHNGLTEKDHVTCLSCCCRTKDSITKEEAIKQWNTRKPMEKQIPKKPTHIHEEYEKHQWKKNKNGEVDDWAWESGFCNGVVCERCGESICVHCNPNYDDEPCIVDKDLCPNCETRVWRYEHKNYCFECGQKLDWEEGGTSD